MGGGRAVSFDDLAYASPPRLGLPEQRIVNGPLLVALHDDAYVDALRGQVTGGLAQVAGYCGWYEKLASTMARDRMGALVCHALLAIAQDDAGAEAKRQAASAQARAAMCEEARGELRALVEGILELSPTGDEDLGNDHVTQLLDLFTELDGACVRVARLGLADAEYEELRKHAEKLASFGAGAQRALMRAEEVRGINAMFITPQRLAIGGAILMGAVLIRIPVAILGAIAAVALFVGYRWLRGFTATEEALKKLRTFGLHARNFLRSGEKEAAT